MAEQPVMDSATDNPSPETVVPTPKPYKNEGEAGYWMEGGRRGGVPWVGVAGQQPPESSPIASASRYQWLGR